MKNDRLGAPYLSFSSRLAAHLAALGVKATHLSLSHSGDYAVAQVILEGETICAAVLTAGEMRGH